MHIHVDYRTFKRSTLRNNFKYSSKFKYVKKWEIAISQRDTHTPHMQHTVFHFEERGLLRTIWKKEEETEIRLVSAHKVNSS